MERIGLQYQKVLFDEKTPLKKRMKFLQDYVKKRWMRYKDLFTERCLEDHQWLLN